MLTIHPEFMPEGRVTGIGSLPHTDADAAVRFVAEFSPQIPFWPQLPQQGPDANMLGQMLAPLLDLLTPNGPARLDLKPGQLATFRQRLRETPVALDLASAAGFFAFERACEANHFPRAVALKCHLTGPLTLAYCLFDQGQPLAASPEVCAALVDYLARLGAWQVERLSRFGKPVLLFIDEPALGMEPLPVGLLETLTRLVGALRATGAYVGVHCCAAATPVALCASQPDIISFDAHLNLETFVGSPPVQAFVAAGGWLALGLIPTWPRLDAFMPLEPFARLASVASAGPTLDVLSRQSFVTATCGLGLLDLAAAQASFEKAQAVSRLVGKVARDSERQIKAAIFQ